MTLRWLVMVLLSGLVGWLATCFLVFGGFCLEVLAGVYVVEVAVDVGFSIILGSWGAVGLFGLVYLYFSFFRSGVCVDAFIIFA